MRIQNVTSRTSFFWIGAAFERAQLDFVGLLRLRQRLRANGAFEIGIIGGHDGDFGIGGARPGDFKGVGGIGGQQRNRRHSGGLTASGLNASGLAVSGRLDARSGGASEQTGEQKWGGSKKI